MFAEDQYENDKAQVIAAAIKKCYIFDDVEVPLDPTTVKKIVKRLVGLRNWKENGLSE